MISFPHIQPQRSRWLRLAISSCVMVQSAIAIATVSEIALPLSGLQSMQVAQAQTSRDAEKVYEKASPAIVFVQTDRGTGSGIILESNGLIVTNAHVIRDAKSVRVQLQNGEWLTAEVVSAGDARCLDLAMLRVKGRSNLPTVKLAEMSSVRRGQLVFAIGYPRGITPSSITQGIVSNLFSEEGLIMTDAALNHGNSGVPC